MTTEVYSPTTMVVSSDRSSTIHAFEEQVPLKPNDTEGSKTNKKNQKCKIPYPVWFIGVVVIAVAFFALGWYANHIYGVTSTFIQPTDKQRICPNFNMTISVTRKEVACDGMNITIFPSFDEKQFIFCPSGTWQQSFNCSGFIFTNNGSGFCNEIKGLPNTFQSSDDLTFDSTIDATTIASTISFIDRETSTKTLPTTEQTTTNAEMNSFANS